MLITAFLLGLLGSFHCVGMCGPIAMALPLSRGQKWQIVQSSLVYNLGRVVTYGLIGLIFGMIGLGVALAGGQKVFSVILGVFLLIFALLPQRMEAFILRLPGLNLLFSQVKQQISSLFKQTSLGANLLIGMLNGLLPCGLVYLAIAGAMTTGHMLDGALFMASFGLGTIPMMLGVTLLGQFLRPNYRQFFRRMAPVIMAVFALLLISRGFNIPIPRELEFWQAIQDPVMCH